MVSPIPEEAHPPHRPMTTSKPSSSVDTAVSTDMSEDDPQHPISLAGLNVKPPPSPAGSVQSVSEDPDAGVSGSAAAGEVPSIPAQKRRRVTRACDECRRKKIKCDGKQPCTHCSAYNYGMFYDPLARGFMSGYWVGRKADCRCLLASFPVLTKY